MGIRLRHPTSPQVFISYGQHTEEERGIARQMARVLPAAEFDGEVF